MLPTALLRMMTRFWRGCTSWRGVRRGDPVTWLPPGPTVPPLAMAEVERAERKLGYRLPQLLRRIYTEIGDGGFGPEGGLASLTPRRVPHWYEPDWPCATTIHAEQPGWGHRHRGSS